MRKNKEKAIIIEALKQLLADIKDWPEEEPFTEEEVQSIYNKWS